MKSEVRVRYITEVSTQDLFRMKQFLLGGGKGNYFVVDSDGTPYGRYENYEDAEEHANALND